MSKRKNGNNVAENQKIAKRQKLDKTFGQVLQLLMNLNMLETKDVINLQRVHKDSQQDIGINIRNGLEIYIDKSFYSCQALTEFLVKFKKQYDTENKKNMRVKIKYVRCANNELIEDLTTIIDKYSKITIEYLDYMGLGVQILLKMIESKKIFIGNLNMNFDGVDLSNTWNKLCKWLQV
jgi:hypothetical protein